MDKKFLLIALFLFSHHYLSSQELADKNATAMTKNLFYNLHRLSRYHVMFGHQSATSYGHSWRNEKDRSDVKDVVGSHPAVIGEDFGGLTSSDTARVNRFIDNQAQKIIDTYNRGGVTTMCWHSNNPVNDGTFYYEKNPIAAVPQILPGKEYHDKYKIYLDRIAEVAHKAVNQNNEPIPFIFRPFHEFDGDWFWWGTPHCSREEFIELWQFTVDYLRNDKKVNTIIYAFSPDCRFTSEEDYLAWYPGDDYVDMLGVDDYWDFRPDGANDPSLALAKLKIVSSVAEAKGKLAAFTETVLEGVKQTDWYTQTLLPILKDEGVKVSYVLVWRNAHDIAHHHYTPFPGHPAADDFKCFTEDETVLLEKGLPNLYADSGL